MIRKLISTSIFILLSQVVGTWHAVAFAQETQAPFTFIVLIDVSGSMDDRFPAPVQPQLSDSTKLMDVKRRLSILADHLPENTRMLVTTFDHEARQLCDLVTNKPAAREELKAIFASIKSRNGSTALWRTVDGELAKAEQLVKANPESRVRVLLYTDGMDQEHNAGLDHSTITKKYGRILQTTVRVDWITIGFDVQADTKASLMAAGFNFTKADKPSDIDPLIAGFNLSLNTVTAGSSITLSDKSVGIGIKEYWVKWGDGTKAEQGKQLQHSFEQPGTYVVRYMVINAEGRRNETSQSVTVTLPQPPVADFILPVRQLTLGLTVQLINRLSEGNLQFKWLLNGKQFSDEQQPQLTIQQYGEHRLELVVIDKFGRSASKQMTLTVPSPKAAQVRAIVPASATPDEQVTFADDSIGDSIESTKWFVDDVFIGQGKVIKWQASPGRHIVRLIVNSSGGSSQSEHSLEVTPHAAPTPGFTVGNPKPRVGDTVTVTDTATGKIDHIEFEIRGLKQLYKKDLKLKEGERFFEFVCDQDGELTLEQKVTGPGGEVTKQARLQVVRSTVQPKARFEVRRGSVDPQTGAVSVTFISGSEGSIDHIELDSGDGQAVKNYRVGESINHTFSPGQWFPKLTVIPADTELSPSTWQGELVIKHPLPAWVYGLVWQIPTATLLVLALYKIRNILLERKRIHQQKLITGSLSVYRRDKPRASTRFDFAGTSQLESIDLPDGSQLKLRLADETSVHKYHIELFRQGNLSEQIGINESERASIGEFMVVYAA